MAGQHPLAFANLLAAVESMAHGLDEVVICGDRPDLVDRLQRRWDPDAVLSWGDLFNVAPQLTDAVKARKG